MGACDYAAVALGSAGGGMWLQVSCSTGLHHPLPLVDLWRWGRGFLGLCVFHLRVGARSKFWGVSGSEDRGGGDNSIQFIIIGREGDKNFKEWQRKIGGGGGE